MYYRLWLGSGIRLPRTIPLGPIYGEDSNGKTYKQSLLWYPKLRNATEEERSIYKFGFDGIHWRNLDEDISFESFGYEEPTSMANKMQ